MKGWMVIFRADPDAKEAHVEDQLCLTIYKKLDKAKRQCSVILTDIWGKDELSDYGVEFAEVTQRGGDRKFMGRPKADVDGTFDLYEVEIV
jgi:hypothetical protein